MTRCTAARGMWICFAAHLANIVLCHTARNITFVLEHQQRGSHQSLSAGVRHGRSEIRFKRWDWMRYLLNKEACELLATVLDPLFVRGIHHPYERVSLLKVVFPIGAKCFLASDIP